MIKTIVFDIGKVLVNFEYDAYVHRLLPDEETVRHVNNAIWETGCWNDLDLGVDKETVIARMLEAEPAYREEILQVISRVGECISGTEYAIPWIQSLKSQGCQVLYLSNYAKSTMDANREALNFLPYMDGGVFSSDLGLVKPDPRIYELLIKKYSLNPETCIYIDDKQTNVDVATGLGMKGMVYKI